MEMNKRPVLVGESSDSYRAFTVNRRTFHDNDWAAYLNQWLAEVAGKRNWF
jgi:sporulation-control protein